LRSRPGDETSSSIVLLNGILNIEDGADLAAHVGAVLVIHPAGLSMTIRNIRLLPAPRRSTSTTSSRRTATRPRHLESCPSPQPCSSSKPASDTIRRLPEPRLLRSPVRLPGPTGPKQKVACAHRYVQADMRHTSSGHSISRTLKTQLRRRGPGPLALVLNLMSCGCRGMQTGDADGMQPAPTRRTEKQWPDRRP